MSEDVKRTLSKEQRKRIETMAVYLIATLIGVVIIWWLFAPDSDQSRLSSGFNVNVPEAMYDELSDDKQSAYQKQQLSDKLSEREQLKSLADQIIGEQKSIEESTPKSSRPNYQREAQTPEEKVVASNEAYKKAQKTVMTFYDEPKVDTEKQKMQEEIAQLKEELSEQQQPTPSMSVDEQLAIVEKSYELAAKYMPASEESKQVTMKGAAEQIEESKQFVNGKAVVNNVERLEQSVVSSLGSTISGGFNTAVGREGEINRNTISACVHSDQTVIDAGAVKLRLLEPMVAGSTTIPINATITGYGKVSGERLSISINNIEYQGLIIPIELAVIDSDGQNGIFIPNSMELNAAKEVVANLSSNMGTTIDVTDQDAVSEILTDVGKGAIKGVSSYVSKKIQQQKIHLKAGYKVLLYQEKKK